VHRGEAFLDDDLGGLGRGEGPGQGGRDREQARDPLDGLLGPPAREQQLPLILAPLASVEDGDAGQQRPARPIAPEHRADQHRELPAIAEDEVERDLVHEPLHVEQRREMSLVEDAAARRQQVLEALAPQQLLVSVAGPGEKRLVDLGENAVGEGGKIAGGRVLIQIFQAFLQQHLVEPRSFHTPSLAIAC